MTNEVQQTRWDRLIRRVSGSIGPGSRVSETISELFPVLDVERVPGELLLLGGTRLMIGGVDSPAVVAEFSQMQLFNPVDSGTLITVTSVQIYTGTGANVFYGLVGLPITTLPANPRTRDSRLGVLNTGVGEVRIDSNAAIQPTLARIRLETNVMLTLQDPNGLAVLGPNSGLQFTHTTANANLRGTFFWRERPAEQSELQF